jgi:mRNA interferase HigB
MQIVNLHLIEEFKRVHAEAGRPMKEWIDRTSGAEWTKPVDVRRMFSSASFVEDYVIFNIGGNKYRLLTEIFYRLKRVNILRVGTHREYDKWKF